MHSATWTRRWRRLVGGFAVLAVLFGLGMDVHAIVMAAHGTHDHGAADISRTSGSMHDHGATGVAHAHAADAAAHTDPADRSSDDGASFTCCAATLCPPGVSVLPMCVGAPTADGHAESALWARVADLAGVGHAPLLRPPR